MPAGIQCHYEVLGVARDADSSTIKKAHRRLALKHHPDKNIDNDNAAEQFRLVQQAYEVLSDPQERKWYDDHREALLAGWSTNGDSDHTSLLFDVVHYMHPGCYSGYGDDTDGFYGVYGRVFFEIVQCEKRGHSFDIDEALPTDFGNGQTEWDHVLRFYQSWESFVSQLNFAWEDKYNSMEDAPDRRIRRLMEEDNKKARRNAKKTYNRDILALVAFVKRRDPRVKAKQAELKQQKQKQAQKQKEAARERKEAQAKAKEQWLEEAQREMDEHEEADRLAGRVRLADEEDDYDYGGGKKRGKKKKKGKRGRAPVEEEEEATPEPVEPENDEIDASDKEQQEKAGESETIDDKVDTEDNAVDSSTQLEGDECANKQLEDDAADRVQDQGDSDEADEPIEACSDADDPSEESEEEEPDIWRCECCRKDFKSEGQMNNHMKSKKHKENFKKYKAKIQKEEEAIMAEMMDELDLDS